MYHRESLIRHISKIHLARQTWFGVSALLWIVFPGAMPTPHLVKRWVVRSYARRYRTRILVETGTYLGDMVEAVSPSFGAVYSIELSRDLAQRARNRFRDINRIHIITGDSGEEIGKLLRRVQEPCLFWLDAHYSHGITARGDDDTPILREIRAITRHHVGGHVILIDDAADFTCQGGYPAVSEIRNIVNVERPTLHTEVKNNIIRITP